MGKMKNGWYLLAGITIVALDSPWIFVKLAVLVGTSGMKAQIIVWSIDNWITASRNTDKSQRKLYQSNRSFHHINKLGYLDAEDNHLTYTVTQLWIKWIGMKHKATKEPTQMVVDSNRLQWVSVLQI